MRRATVLFLSGLLALPFGAGPAIAQKTGPAATPRPEGSADAGGEALALFERVCLAAMVRGEAADAVARGELRDATPIPAEQLRRNANSREAAGWRVRGRHATYTVMIVEPGTQCAVYAQGVAPGAFLDAARQLLLRQDRLPGWSPRGEPQTWTAQRPFGTLTFLSVSYVPAASKPGVPARASGATVTVSAANRTDGRADTAVISMAFEPPATPR